MWCVKLQSDPIYGYWRSGESKDENVHDSLERVSDQLSVDRREVQVCSSGCVSFMS